MDSKQKRSVQELRGAGFRIREARPADARRLAIVGVDTWRSTYSGIVSDEYLNNLSYSRSEAKWQCGFDEDASDCFTYVAETAEGEVVGYALAGPEREGIEGCPAELYALYVLKEHQGKGIGRELVKAVISRFISQGIHSMLIWVLADNPSRGFYERIGGRELLRKMISIGGHDLEEVGYLWNDIHKIALL